jgi:2-amino-4-hydroxy-6-hydroxymethyldihydropteridine diphosphokinase
MAEVVIGLGSNIGDTQMNVHKAWELLGREPDVTLQGLSSPYSTEPVGMDSTNWFTNGVGFAYTDLTPEKLLGVLHRIETTLGRSRPLHSDKWVDRIVDLDLLFYDDLISTTPELVVPHPGIQNRLFVLAPLAELLPDKKHSVLGLTASEMLARLLTSGDSASQPEVRKTQWRQDVMAHHL